MMKAILDRVEGSLRGGALGDSYGAHVEILKLDTILERFGEEGVQKLLPYDPGDYLKYAPCEQTGVGVITDDTCMTMATLVGLQTAQAAGETPINAVHQAYLRWGRKQAWAEGDYDKLIDQTYEFPKWFDSFCFSSGAGKNTLAALNSGKIGTVEEPIGILDKKGKPILSEGCGGMMRVAPVGWLQALGGMKLVSWDQAISGRASEAYRLGRQTAAITHGGDIAQHSSGAIAALIAYLCLGYNWTVAIQKMRNDIAAEAGEESVMAMLAVAGMSTDFFHYTQKMGHRHPVDRARMRQPFWITSVPKEKIKEIEDCERVKIASGLFASPTVFMQVLLICNAAQTWEGPPSERMAWARTLAVTQDGDSDSVAAIVGNVLGAQMGAMALEDDLDRPEHTLQSHDALTAALPK